MPRIDQAGLGGSPGSRRSRGSDFSGRVRPPAMPTGAALTPVLRGSGVPRKAERIGRALARPEALGGAPNSLTQGNKWRKPRQCSLSGRFNNQPREPHGRSTGP